MDVRLMSKLTRRDSSISDFDDCAERCRGRERSMNKISSRALLSQFWSATALKSLSISIRVTFSDPGDSLDMISEL